MVGPFPILKTDQPIGVPAPSSEHNLRSFGDKLRHYINQRLGGHRSLCQLRARPKKNPRGTEGSTGCEHHELRTPRVYMLLTLYHNWVRTFG